MFMQNMVLHHLNQGIDGFWVGGSIQMLCISPINGNMAKPFAEPLKPD